MNRLFLILLSLVLFVASVHAASSTTSFCKCTCFSNSTIIALNPPSPSPSASSSSHSLLRSLDTRAQHLSCTSCNRAFCLSYNLPICRGATEADVFTTCFQRDSLKDEAVVFIFIFATAGLLGWAIIKPFVQQYFPGMVSTGGVSMGNAERRNGGSGRYVPLTGERQGLGNEDENEEEEDVR